MSADQHGGTGLQPVGSPAMLAGFSASIFQPFNPAAPTTFKRRNLPHWYQEGCTYFVTFRLSDSVPQGMLDQWTEEREIWMRHHPGPWDGKTIAEYHARFHETQEKWLDQGHGECVLRDLRASSIIMNAIQHFDGDRYILDVAVVMPNHVHAVLKPLSLHELPDILHSWKSFTAREVNRLLKRTGTLWMDESYDHIIRDTSELERLRLYIERNPVEAALREKEYNLRAERVFRATNQASHLNGDPGRMPGLPTGCKPVSQLQFPLCKIEGNEGWKKFPGTMVYDGPYVQIEECTFLTPARPEKPTPWTVAHRKSAIAVAPITEDGRFILIHQERLPVQRSLWEFPAGQIDDEHSCESIVATVLRELDEEAGAELTPTGTLTPLGWFFGSQGFTSEHVYLFAAHPVHIVRQPQPVGGEHIGEVQLVTGEILREMITNNTIQDALTLALFARMTARGMV